MMACQAADSNSVNDVEVLEDLTDGPSCGVNKWDLLEYNSQTNTSFSADIDGDYDTPTQKVSRKNWPKFEDDLDFDGMELAINRQLRRYKNSNLNQNIYLGGKKYPLKDVPKALTRFLQITKSYQACLKSKGTDRKDCVDKFNNILIQDFDLFEPKLLPEDPRYGEAKPTLFTAYYTPLIKGRDYKSKDSPYSVYANPKDENLLLHDRLDIDFKGALVNRGLDLFFADDLFDLYLLHVQGGGRVEIENRNGKRSSYYISYDGTNKKSFTFISKYMASMGYIKDLSIESQRRFLKNNPQKQAEIYATCPSYVFFQKTSEPPYGSDAVPLTDNRSIATDTTYYKFKGLLSYVVTKRPVPDPKQSQDCNNTSYKDYSRFFLDQDTGGAIRGKARVDLYFGEGDYAEFAAYNTVQRGDLYFLMLK